MNQTSQNILIILQNENFKDLLRLKEFVELNHGLDIESQEMKFDDAFNLLMRGINTLEGIINSDNNYFDELVSYTKKKNIYLNISSIDQQINNIFSGINQIPNLINSIQTLWDLLREVRLVGFDSKSKEYSNYKEKIKEINKLQLTYLEFIKSLKGSDLIIKKSNDILLKLEDMFQKTSNINKDIVGIKNKISAEEQDINLKYEQIQVLNGNIINYESNLNIIKSSIEQFFNKINDYEASIKNNIDLIESNIAENNAKTIKIISENINIQTEIYDILGKAVGTNLFKSFNYKSRWMFGQSIFWLICLCLSLWFLTDSGIFIFNQLKELLVIGKIKDLTLTFYLRITLIFPSIYAVYFSTSEFKNNNKLRAEYDFKSAVAVGLHYFKELVENTENEKDKEFLINTIMQIFSSPTEKVFGNKDNQFILNKDIKKLVKDLAEISSKILPK